MFIYQFSSFAPDIAHIYKFRHQKETLIFLSIFPFIYLFARNYFVIYVPQILYDLWN